MPVDQAVRGPFLRYEVIEDRFVKLKNRDLIARPEFFDQGPQPPSLQVRGPSSVGFRPVRAWLYSASATRGSPCPGSTTCCHRKAQRQIASTGSPLTQAASASGTTARRARRASFFVGLAGDRLGEGGGAPTSLLLGATTGLRGYPLRYQAASAAPSSRIEQRYYTDWYIFRLARVGGAAFYACGRAWGGANQNAENGAGFPTWAWASPVLRRARSATCCTSDVAAGLSTAPRHSRRSSSS